MKPPRFAYCRMCGARWVNLGLISVEWHKPGCRLLDPAKGATEPERPRVAHGDNAGITLRAVRS